MDTKCLKKELEKDLIELIKKYKLYLNAFEITESIIGFITCTSCSAAHRHDELHLVEYDLIELIKKNVEKTKEYFKDVK
jgi:hypothetical protein